MSEKYTIEDIRDSPPFTWTLLENKVMIGSFDTEGIAELVCKLLNENEERKNQPKIDKKSQNEIIKHLESEIEELHSIIELNSTKVWCNEHRVTIEKYTNAIEIISNLPVEEN